MAETVRITVEPEVLDLYPPPKSFEEIWNLGSVYSHQYAALTTESKVGRIHAPTATGKSRAAAFFAVSPFHLGKSDMIRATFAYPTNILTSQQFERSLIEGLVDNLRYKDKGKGEWRQSSTNNTTIPYRRLEIPEGGELRIAKLTGADVADILQDDAIHGGKADILQEFLDWLNQGHSFLVCSPDLIAYAVHEIYGSSSLYYHSTVKRRLHSLLRGRTFILDEYHQYDPFTLINLERLLLADENLAPDRILLLSATERKDYFPDIQNIIHAEKLPDPIDRRTASREIFVDFHFGEHIPEPELVNSGLTLFIHDSVIQNRSRSKHLRALGLPVIQWDGTRKDVVKDEELGLFYHLVMGTAAIEVGLDTDADCLITEWNPSWTTPDHTIQRIGRVGRRESPDPAQVKIYMPGALDVLSNKILKHHGQRMTKSQLNVLIYEASGNRSINRRDYVSNYFSKESQETLADKNLLHSHEKLRYSFRPPGSQALFLDRTEGKPLPFLYGKAQILNRYDKRPPTPEDLASVNEGWKRLCNGLGLKLEEDFFVIIGERKQREWLRVPDGTIEDLKRPDMRKYYVERERRL